MKLGLLDIHYKKSILIVIRKLLPHQFYVQSFIGVHKKLKLAEMMSEILVSKQDQEQFNINI